MSKKRSNIPPTQQSLPFAKVNEQPDERGAHFHLYVDGAARNNPGPAGAGMYLTREDKPIFAFGHYLGTKTNNQAEYLGLVLGLLHAQKHLQPHDELSIFADSQLLVRQMNGEYAVRNEGLKPLYTVARKLIQPYKRSRMQHIYREHNEHADKLANEGLDKKIVIPAPMKNWLNEHGIVI